METSGSDSSGMVFRPLPEKYRAFLREYRQLCKKHGLMVLSEGEQVEVGEYRNDLWGVARTTVDNICRPNPITGKWEEVD